MQVHHYFACNMACQIRNNGKSHRHYSLLLNLPHRGGMVVDHIALVFSFSWTILVTEQCAEL
jgi:hypothetical protein